MSTRHTPRDTISVKSPVCAVVLFGCLSLAVAQATERESLKEPVYRISKTNAPGAAPSGIAEPASPDSVGRRPLIDAQTAAQASPPAALAAAVPEGNSPASSSAAPATPAGTNAPLPETVATQPTSRDVMLQALADAEQIVAHIQSDIDDYTCMFIKRENVKGKILPTECIQAKIRNRKVVDGKIVVPFSVYMKFLKPQAVSGREILFVEGQHNNQLLAKEGGNAGRFLPSVWLNLDSRFVVKENRYPLTEVGIENLAMRLIERGRADIDNIDDCDVTYTSGAKVGGRPCRVLTVRRHEPKRGAAANQGMNVNLAMVFVDEQLNIPIRYGAYDWPDVPGGQGPVVEEYTYYDLKVNVGLTDADFDSENPDYDF